MIKKLDRSCLDMQSTTVYDFNELTLQELLSKFFEKINNCIDVSNQALTFLEWLKQEGLPIEVQKEIEKMYLDGRLTEIINKLADNVNEKVDNVLLYQSDKPLSEYNKVWVEDISEETVGDLVYLDKEIDRVTNKIEEIDITVTNTLQTFGSQLEQTKNNFQGQIDTLVLESGGESNLEVVQARVSNDGNVFVNLKGRTDNIENKIDNRQKKYGFEWEKGHNNAGSLSDNDYRIRTKNIILIDHDIDIIIDEGYQLAINVYNKDKVCVGIKGWHNSGAYKLKDLIKDGLQEELLFDFYCYFGFVIRKNPEETWSLNFANHIHFIDNYELLKEKEIKLKHLSDEVINNLKKTNTNEVDLFVFMGQSNMSGRGDSTQTPIVPSGWGYEFKAYSDPTKLYSIDGLFGSTENNANGMNDTGKGGLVPSFVNAYYPITKTPIVGIKCAVGGTTISQWQDGGVYLTDTKNRITTTINWLNSNGYTIKNKYMVWLQGESDADSNTSKDTYKTNFKAMLSSLKLVGIEKCFIIRVGSAGSDTMTHYPDRLNNIIQAQTELAQLEDDICMIATNTTSFTILDNYGHFNQDEYNKIGKVAGTNAGFYSLNKKEPTMYDSKNDNLYYPKKVNIN